MKITVETNLTVQLMATYFSWKEKQKDMGMGDESFSSGLG
jgi:hypothetical protein